jgi:hypothetical protein
VPCQAKQLVIAVVALVACPLEAQASPGVPGPGGERAAIAGLAFAGAHEHVHADGSPCPDDGDEPCDDGCACACCHGHSPAKAGVPRPPRVAAGDAPRPLPIARPSDLHPIELIQRVFRPPRA